jgi:hypothetical protein
MSTDEIPAEKPEKRKRYPRKSRVFQNLDLSTTRGRRVRALYARYLDRSELQDGDLIHQSAVLKVVKLQSVVERLLDESLKSKKHNHALGDELVRHENLLRRAKLELSALAPKADPGAALAAYLAGNRQDDEDGEDQDADADHC